MPPLPRGGFAELLAPELRRVYLMEPFEQKSLNWMLEEQKRAQERRAKLEQKILEQYEGSRKAKNKPEPWVLIANVVCIRESEKALFVRVPALDEDHPASDKWIPKSQVNFDESEVKQAGDQGMLIVKEWIAREKGWL